MKMTTKTRRKQERSKYSINLLDKIFSYYIRLRDSEEYGNCQCISCGRVHYWYNSGMDCGHYIKRQWMGTRFNEYNCNAQCRYCNNYLQGNDIEYRKGLEKKIGAEKLAIMEAIPKHRRKIPEYVRKELIFEYASKVLAEIKKLPYDDLRAKIEKEMLNSIKGM